MSRQPTSLRRAFTLVELMIAVAIVGILAAIAVPSFQDAILRSRRAEARVNLAGMAVAEDAYNAAFDDYVSAGPNPGGGMGKDLRPWLFNAPGWEELDFDVSGDVRCNYYIYIFGAPEQYYRATAECDVDGDDTTYLLRYYSKEYPGGVTWQEPLPWAF
jgi:prepilin-type N-terminal cleavage/methylation domain-containing protein